MARKIFAVALSVLVALAPLATSAAPAMGTIQGLVTVEGKPLSGMGLALVDLKSGSIHRTKSGADGGFRVQVAPGEYVLTNYSLAGLAVGRAPARVVVVSGRVASATIDLMKLPVAYVQAPQEPGQAAGNIQHEKIGCLVAGQFPLIEATIEPAASVARARVYFKSALGPAYYFVEMTLVGGKFQGKLPKPMLQASPITYYIQATTTEFGESQTPEIETQVVADESECPEGLKVAPVGPPGVVTVFSATTATAVTPVGFAAGAAGGIAGLVGGIAGVLGAAAGVAGLGGASPTPVPTATPTAPSSPPVSCTYPGDPFRTRPLNCNPTCIAPLGGVECTSVACKWQGLDPYKSPPNPGECPCYVQDVADPRVGCGPTDACRYTGDPSFVQPNNCPCIPREGALTCQPLGDRGPCLYVDAYARPLNCQCVAPERDVSDPLGCVRRVYNCDDVRTNKRAQPWPYVIDRCRIE